MSFRKEKKYQFSYSNLVIFQNNLFKRGMKELYVPRIISSCYFDTNDLKMYHESEEGVLPRKKMRLRWYNNKYPFIKETKISSIEGRFKYTDSYIEVKDNLKDSKFFDKEYGNLFPILKVSYTREYYTYNSLRMTFDTKISYESLKSNVTNISYDNECVMEIKAPSNCSDDYIDNLVSIPSNRFSKYTRGIQISRLI
tara:strand:+ start:1453 stop:2043 length:591 start_codon:yes stop_codon:yes gene_type:complete